MTTRKYKETDEIKKEVFFYLGLLSTLFAKMESKLLDILGKYITPDFVLAKTLFEKNTLSNNIEMLKSINKLKSFETKTVENLIQKIFNIRKTRNLFIHGIWSEPIQRDNDILILCQESKLDYTEVKENGKRIRQHWASHKDNEFKLSYIRKLVDDVEEILFIENYLLKKLDDYDYDD